MLTILQGNALEQLGHIPDRSIQCCCTSPPYWGLRDYGNADQIGLERTFDEYIVKLVAVFREVRRVLTDDGTLWLNLGDSYATGAGAVGECPGGGEQGERWKSRGTGRPHTNGRGEPQEEVKLRGYKGARGGHEGKHAYLGGAHGVGPMTQPNRLPQSGLKPKDLVMIPARMAIALQADGWYLRSQIPWVKRQAMPESVEDRPNSAVEYVFLLTKQERYYYDCAAVKVLAQSGPSDVRKMLEKKERIDAKHFHDDPGPLAAANPETNIGKKRGVGGTVVNKNETSGGRTKVGFNARWDVKNSARLNGDLTANNHGDLTANNHGDQIETSMVRNWRNSDSFFESIAGLLGNENGDPLAFCVNPQPFRGAHFATWPQKLVQPMILAGTKAGDVVLDPFLGSGTTGKVALELGRRCIGIELNPEYVAMAEQRCETTVGLAL